MFVLQIELQAQIEAHEQQVQAQLKAQADMHAQFQAQVQSQMQAQVEMQKLLQQQMNTQMQTQMKFFKTQIFPALKISSPQFVKKHGENKIWRWWCFVLFLNLMMYVDNCEYYFHYVHYFYYFECNNIWHVSYKMFGKIYYFMLYLC